MNWDRYRKTATNDLLRIYKLLASKYMRLGNIKECWQYKSEKESELAREKKVGGMSNALVLLFGEN